jgi:hypothetical protein
MKTNASKAVLMALLFLGATAALSRAAEDEGVALAIVYDTSGSMAAQVRDAKGQLAPKYVIANHALEAVAQRLQAFATNAATGAPRKVMTGLFVFADQGATPALPFGPFKAAALQAWARDFHTPKGGTPLGNAIRTAAQATLHSNLSRKHVLILTDGESNIGPAPAAVLPELKRQADQKQTGVSYHFIAFDVNAKVFDGVKKLGATVVGAANETQLNTQLEFILEKKILLEEEETPKSK